MKEGKTPMEKNVTVVDEQGHVYGATYPKRAKGLVKNGRARFVDENTICLACPPNQILEDTEMSENINIQGTGFITLNYRRKLCIVSHTNKVLDGKRC
jgi:hypothetical protein